MQKNIEFYSIQENERKSLTKIVMAYPNNASIRRWKI
jgi:hypothetical protein